jgi:hypothetical protein
VIRTRLPFGSAAALAPSRSDGAHDGVAEDGYLLGLRLVEPHLPEERGGDEDRRPSPIDIASGFRDRRLLRLAAGVWSASWIRFMSSKLAADRRR